MDPAGCDPLPSWFSHFFLPFQLEVGMRQTGQREIGDAASLRHGEELLGQSVGGTGGEQVLLLLLGSCTWSCSHSGPWGAFGVEGLWSWCPAGILRRNLPGKSCSHGML